MGRYWSKGISLPLEDEFWRSNTSFVTAANNAVLFSQVAKKLASKGSHHKKEITTVRVEVLS